MQRNLKLKKLERIKVHLFLKYFDRDILKYELDRPSYCLEEK